MRRIFLATMFLAASLSARGQEATAPAARPLELAPYRSDFYAVQTQLAREDAREEAAVYARHMDGAFGEYCRRFEVRPGDVAAMPLFLLATRDDYEAFLAGHGIDGAGSDGIFFRTPTASGLATFAHGRSQNRTLAVLRHEGFHQFAHSLAGAALPPWANEGLAEYFAAGIVAGGQFDLGQVAPLRLEILQDAIRRGDAIRQLVHEIRFR